MKQLARKPLLSSSLLAIPLWIVLDNFIVAIAAALLIGFLISMSYSLWVLNRKPEHEQKPLPRERE